MSAPHLLLGGADLEMAAIADLAREAIGAERVHDRGLAWGARASAYADLIAEIAACGERAILVELVDDLTRDAPREAVTFVDHHGAAAGADRPSSLRQVFDLLDMPASRWTRTFELIAANDVGHIEGLRRAGASPEEIRAIRDADRAAQGLSAEDEASARRAVLGAERRGPLTVVSFDGRGGSAIGDLLEPEYGGPGAPDLLTLSPSGCAFYGTGDVVLALAASHPGSWSGGALPERGYWGSDRCDRQALVRQVETLLKGRS